MGKPSNPGGGGGGGTLSVKGTKGNDVFTVATEDALGRTAYDGAAGVDTLNLAALSSPVRIMLSGGASDASDLWINPDPDGHMMWASFPTYTQGRISGTIRNVENVIGTSGNDFLAGPNYVNNRLEGGPGDDVLSGGGYDTDILVGGPGSDVLEGIGSDRLVGGALAAPADGATDRFVVGTFATVTIAGFEPGVDRLVFVAPYDGPRPALTVSSTANGTLVTFGSASALLEGVSQAAFEAGHPVGNVIGGYGRDPLTLVGSTGEDWFYTRTIAPDELVISADSGNDFAKWFETGLDSIRLDGVAVTSFSETAYNGTPYLVVHTTGGSLSLEGLTMADSAAIAFV